MKKKKFKTAPVSGVTTGDAECYTPENFKVRPVGKNYHFPLQLICFSLSEKIFWATDFQAIL